MGRGIPWAFLSGRVEEEGVEGEEGEAVVLWFSGSQLWTRMICGVVDGMCDVMRGYYGRAAG